MITKLELRALVFCSCFLVSALAQNLIGCETSSSYYICNENIAEEKCKTYAILRANTYYSSVSNISNYFSINRSELLEVNGFSPNTDILWSEEPLLIPIECKCSNGGVFEAELRKKTLEGESFYEIAEFLEGLTSCKSIQEKNKRISAWSIQERTNLSVPLECAFPLQSESGKVLLSYPVKEGDTLAQLALRFNVTEESIVAANRNHSRTVFRLENSLVPFSTVLIPAEGQPLFNFLEPPEEPSLRNPAASIQVRDSQKKKKKPKMWMIGVYIGIGLTCLLASIGIGAAFVFFMWMRKRQDSIKNINGDLELQKLSLSIRTTSDKKISFEGSHYNFDDPIPDSTTPHKIPIENYSFEELKKATEDFNASYLIEGSVFHGRLKGKILAIKRTNIDIISKIDYMFFQERVHRHPNLIRLMGTCIPPPSRSGPDAFMVFEYAKNGSLKDWIHGGLAIKTNFIASCNCFLTWNQRLKISLDVATALQYMHHIINLSYTHRNIRSRNIFLDEDFNAKIGNFGMANCVGEPEADDQDSSYSSQGSWNKGYLAPECNDISSISTSLDIFAYGVVLLEVLSGKPPVKSCDDEGGRELVKLSDDIKQILKSDNAEGLREWMDAALGENYSFDAAVTLANLARSCVEDDPSLRPNAGEIVEKLRRLVEELQDGDHFNICESSCKPLVSSVARGR